MYSIEPGTFASSTYPTSLRLYHIPGTNSFPHRRFAAVGVASESFEFSVVGAALLGEALSLIWLWVKRARLSECDMFDRDFEAITQCNKA
jgi:hypothetical protein